jgi:hypothetical protein
MVEWLSSTEPYDSIFAESLDIPAEFFKCHRIIPLRTSHGTAMNTMKRAFAEYLIGEFFCAFNNSN